MGGSRLSFTVKAKPVSCSSNITQGDLERKILVMLKMFKMMYPLYSELAGSGAPGRQKLAKSRSPPSYLKKIAYKTDWSKYKVFA